MLELHYGNVQHNDLFIDNIILHWELDGSLKIGIYDWGCTLHMGENVESLWHMEPMMPRNNGRRNFRWLSSCLGSTIRDIKICLHIALRKLRVLLSTNKLAWQLCNYGHDPILFTKVLDHDTSIFVQRNLGGCIDLVCVRR